MASLKQIKQYRSSLSTDLLFEIFLKLPSKDTVVCKCVCKTWHGLLSHPNFSRHYAKNPPFTSVFLFRYDCKDKISYAFLVDITAVDGRLIKTRLTTNIPNFFLNPLRKVTDFCDSYVIGSCNGLLFFHEKRVVFHEVFDDEMDNFDEVFGVYCSNPLTGECVLLAEQKWARWPHYRVGYDPSTGKIKLLVFFNGNTQHNTQPVHILTVGVDRSWRYLEDSLDYFKPRGSFIGGVKVLYDGGVSFNGAYHWIYGDSFPTCLKTFDLGREKIGPEWKLPRDSVEYMSMIKLAVVNNHISVIENLPNYELVIWTMEEYGNAESWSRKTVKRVRPEYCLPKLQATLSNGDLVFSKECENGDGFTFVSLEKEDRTIDVCNRTTKSGTLYVAEFAPKFCSLNDCWNI